MGVIAKRLTSWAIDNDLVSKEQKSARPSEGCYEHTFLRQSIIADTRRSHKNVCVFPLSVFPLASPVQIIHSLPSNLMNS